MVIKYYSFFLIKTWTGTYSKQSSFSIISVYWTKHFAVISVILPLILFLTLLALSWPSPQRIPAFPWVVKPYFLYRSLSTVKWLKLWPHCFPLPAAQQAPVFSAPAVGALLFAFYPNSCLFPEASSLLLGNLIITAVSEPSSSLELSPLNYFKALF